MIAVELDLNGEWDTEQDWQALADKAVAAAFAVSSHGALANAPFAISVSINLSTDAEVHQLNAQWRGKDRPTNVLSFPMLNNIELQQLRHSRESGNPSPEGDSFPGQVMDPRLRGGDDEVNEILLGDLILAHNVCATEAEEKQIPLTQHVTHLIVHGTLHLLGLDHMDDAEADHMEALEVKALASLGIDNPYRDD